MSGGTVVLMINGRPVCLEPKQARMVRERAKMLREKNIRIARELKQEGMLPHDPSNQFGGWVSPSASQEDVQFAISSQVVDPRD